VIRLRPLREGELAGFFADAKAQYAIDIELHAGWTEADARAKAQRDLGGLFPGGQPREGLVLRVVEETEGGEPVGRVMFTEREVEGRPVLWLYEIFLGESVRGRGLGKAAMRLLEDEARSRGAERIELNVFGGNETARSLYRSLGYGEVAVVMSKHLTG
jgi:GNAT superfamily N-acetyltransferase